MKFQRANSNVKMAKSLNDKLPQYSPPESVWENIEQGLNDAPLQEALSKLPIYEPPVQTWFDIAAQVPNYQIHWWRYPVAASVAVLIIGFGEYLASKQAENLTIGQSYAHIQALAQQEATTFKSSNKTIKQSHANIQALAQQEATTFKSDKKTIEQSHAHIQALAQQEATTFKLNHQ
jgi:two-component sensor histidine kinase